MLVLVAFIKTPKLSLQHEPCRHGQNLTENFYNSLK